MTSSKKEAVRPPNAGKGRPNGAVNKTTKVLKEAIIMAAEEAGQDGKGKGGLVGYLVGLATTQPKAFASLLGRVIPLQVEGAGENGEHIFQKIVVEVVKAEK